MVSKQKRMPLEGIRIADFTWVQAGPWIGRHFAIYGAEVIRIESSLRPDLLRLYPLGIMTKDGTQHMDAMFNTVNCDKLGITLNLTHPKGVEIAKRLISVSDIVIDNFGAGQMDKFGLGYEELIKIKPDIIMLSMPSFGNSGPYRNFGAYGTGLQAAVGVNLISGFPHRKAGTLIQMALTDTGPVPDHGMVALLSALHYRNRTGKGQFIESAQFESSLSWMGTLILDYTANNRLQSRQGNRLPYAAPHGVYRCQGDDRWCAVAVFTDQEWKAFCNAIGNPPWTREERFATLPRRKKNEDDLDKLVGEWTQGKTPEEAMKLLQKRGVAAGVVETMEDLMVFDEQVQARKYFITMDHPQGEMVCENTTIGLSDTPGKVRHAGPTMGQDNEYVYKEILNMPEEERNQCYVDGVFD